MHFFEENAHDFIPIGQMFVPNSLIANMSTLIQVMAWYQTGAQALSEPMVS